MQHAYCGPKVMSASLFALKWFHFKPCEDTNSLRSFCVLLFSYGKRGKRDDEHLAGDFDESSILIDCTTLYSFQALDVTLFASHAL